MNEHSPDVVSPTDLPVAFEVFFHREQKAFLATATSRLRDRRDAEEAVLEAGRRMYNKWERILAHANPKAMTHAILNGVVIDFYRREVRNRHVQPFAEPPDTAYLEELREHEALDLALDELESVAPLQANSVRLRHLVGLSYDQIAETLDTTPGAVKVSTCLGLQRLKEIMTASQQGEGDT
ncbi:RNA polymerase sigma factor [Streptomyces piniterrae]|uniref:RNA polymerase sigma factor n=1 Tax=Streptomyces piniterrae TaxID=2571125 RepID=UPI00145FA7E3|nr:sigma factor-like helix-turn-helix DNA-binding protein [Streptomyces piniterrae]